MIIHDILHHIVPVAHAAAEEAQTGGVAGLLGINWKLFVAQLINFAIVLFVLWKWVFGPLGKKLQERTEKIEKSLNQSKEIEEKLRNAEDTRLQEIEKARKDANDIVLKAQKAAEQTKEGILAEAKKSAEGLIEQARKQIESEKNRLMTEIKEETANMVVMATEKIIREKLDPKKDEHLIKESLKDIKG